MDYSYLSPDSVACLRFDDATGMVKVAHAKLLFDKIACYNNCENAQNRLIFVSGKFSETLHFSPGFSLWSRNGLLWSSCAACFELILGCFGQLLVKRKKLLKGTGKKPEPSQTFHMQALHNNVRLGKLAS
jgi:hypothetical protein